MREGGERGGGGGRREGARGREQGREGRSSHKQATGVYSLELTCSFARCPAGNQAVLSLHAVLPQERDIFLLPSSCSQSNVYIAAFKVPF